MTDYTQGFEDGKKAVEIYAPLTPSEVCELVGVSLYEATEGETDEYTEGFIAGAQS